MSGGCVILVGAGPGDPGLLTVAGREALASAEAVLHDRLANPGILAHAPDAAERIDVGKRAGDHPVPQDEINRLLIDRARAGKRVVRLKGGDPYLFGRGAEEAAAVAAAGIPFRVIPGVTSALAAPAWAGMPVTRRGVAQSVHIFTAHARDGGEPDIPYDVVARLPGTLVFLMGLAVVETVCERLAGAGLAGDTPAAAIENGTLPTQRRVDATLATLPGAVRRAGLTSPALLVVGAAAAPAPELDWAARLPLAGRRLLAASSATTAARLALLLRRHGAEVDELAAVVRRPLPPPDGLWTALPGYDWIVLTSAYGVERFFAAIPDIRLAGRARFAAVGSRTAAALARHGVTADYVPDRADGRALGQGLAGRLPPGGGAVLLYRAANGGAGLAERLRAAGARLDDVPAYRTDPAEPDPDILAGLAAGRYHGVTFTSASALRALPADAPLPPVFCIGEASAAAVRERGADAAVAAAATVESLADLVMERLGNHAHDTE